MDAVGGRADSAAASLLDQDRLLRLECVWLPVEFERSRPGDDDDEDVTLFV
jgi:hypothetical protein